MSSKSEVSPTRKLMEYDLSCFDETTAQHLLVFPWQTPPGQAGQSLSSLEQMHPSCEHSLPHGPSSNFSPTRIHLTSELLTLTPAQNHAGTITQRALEGGIAMSQMSPNVDAVPAVDKFELYVEDDAPRDSTIARSLKSPSPPQKRYMCLYPSCRRCYLSTDAARKHCKMRHAEWLKMVLERSDALSSTSRKRHKISSFCRVVMAGQSDTGDAQTQTAVTMMPVANTVDAQTQTEPIEHAAIAQ